MNITKFKNVTWKSIIKTLTVSQQRMVSWLQQVLYLEAKKTSKFPKRLATLDFIGRPGELKLAFLLMRLSQGLALEKILIGEITPLAIKMLCSILLEIRNLK